MPHEYINNGTEAVRIIASPDSTSDAVAEVAEGCVVTVGEIYGDFGLVISSDFTGWVDISQLEGTEKNDPYEEETEPVSGDVNADGKVDTYDLTILNEYLRYKESLPDGISVLTEKEKSIADMNGDSQVDTGDVLILLTLICR